MKRKRTRCNATDRSDKTAPANGNAPEQSQTAARDEMGSDVEEHATAVEIPPNSPAQSLGEPDTSLSQDSDSNNNSDSDSNARPFRRMLFVMPFKT